MELFSIVKSRRGLLGYSIPDRYNVGSVAVEGKTAYSGDCLLKQQHWLKARQKPRVTVLRRRKIPSLYWKDKLGSTM